MKMRWETQICHSPQLVSFPLCSWFRNILGQTKSFSAFPKEKQSIPAVKEEITLLDLLKNFKILYFYRWFGSLLKVIFIICDFLVLGAHVGTHLRRDSTLLGCQEFKLMPLVLLLINQITSFMKVKFFVI